MSEEAPTPSGSGGLQETIVTLPRPIVATLAVLLVAASVGSGWLAATAAAEGVREVAKSVLLVLLPMMVVVAAAIGIRRTSTAQVDQLVTAFVEKTVLARFQLACRHRTFHDFPFKAVRLAVPTHCRSYAAFDFTWHESTGRRDKARVWVKMNVVNFEVIVEQAIVWPDSPDPMLPNKFFDHGNLDEVLTHAFAKHIAMTVQGSIEEGYKVRVLLQRQEDGSVVAKLSFRQKLREHFLASPFLRRYYAEDASILVGVLFYEMAASGLLPPPAARG